MKTLGSAIVRDEAFWAKVDRSAGPLSCWPWTGARWLGYSYGHLERNGHKIKAHRYAWEQTFGPIPAGLLACHRCDNPPCCNPAHLFLGTDADNVADKMAKGRGPTGERHRSRTRPDTIQRGVEVASAKLTEDQVRDIRLRYSLGGIRQKDLGAEFGLTQTGISHIVLRKSWGHVP